MSIGTKILLYFSVITTILVGIALLFIYTLFYEYREEEFHAQQKNKIITTLKLLTEVRNIDEQLIQAMDQITINDFFDEKLLLYDHNKQLIYASIDDTTIPHANDLLEQLSPEMPWLEHKEAHYDVIGMHYREDGLDYYGISKAYDASGYQNLNYLKYELFITFFCIMIVVVFMSSYLARKITKPIEELTSQINAYDFDMKSDSQPVSVSKNEVIILTERFNALMKKMNAAFSFQKHAIHHISHELKTPIAILVSNFEKIEKEKDQDRLIRLIRNQKDETMNLSEIINSLLELAKTESGNVPLHTQVRVDEVLFDVAEELNLLYPEFQFCIDYAAGIESETSLTLLANDRLLKACFSNLMMNCIQYSNENKATILISPAEDGLTIKFINKGAVILEQEKEYIFQHFFRGENSKGKRGFGLGLVFVHKILALHGGAITYSSEGENMNIFFIHLPLSQN